MLDPLSDGISSVELVDKMGDDNRVVDSARVSYAKLASNYSEEENSKLIRYLASHNHWTPFSQCLITFRIKMPIFVAREWYRHNVGLTRNEVSRRYVNSEPELYFPKELRNKPEKGQSKQGSSGVHAESDYWKVMIQSLTENSAMIYQEMIEDGIAPEQARMILPVNTYTEFIETGSLAAYSRICSLRISDDAMKECRVFAEAVSKLIAPLFPVSWGELIK